MTKTTDKSITVIDEKSEIDKLAKKADAQMRKIDAIGKKMAIEIYRAGELLDSLKTLLKTCGGWTHYQGTRGWSIATVCRYINFYLAAKSQQNLENMSYTEANKMLFGDNVKKDKAPTPNQITEPLPEIPTPQQAIGLALTHLADARAELHLLTGQRDFDKAILANLKQEAESLLEQIKELEER